MKYTDPTTRKEENKMTIEIYWNDLTEEKQQELLNLLGDNQNWDVFPIAEIEIEEEDAE